MRVEVGPDLCTYRNSVKRSIDESVVVFVSLINEPLDDVDDVDLGAIGRLDTAPMRRNEARH
jgi:hypothetical protein